jgi:hypothetical protein
MRVRSVLFGSFVVALLLGFACVGVSHATLDFADWPGTWFKVKVSETGKIGIVVPPGGDVDTNNEKTTTTYLLVDTWDLSTTTYSVAYCTFDGSVWTRNSGPGLNWPVLGGEPEDFLTLFTFTYPDAAGSLQTYWVPLNIKGKDQNNATHIVNSASFKNLGGIFLEERVAQRGIGSLKFTGSFIKPDKVASEVPPGCAVGSGN